MVATVTASATAAATALANPAAMSLTLTIEEATDDGLALFLTRLLAPFDDMVGSFSQFAASCCLSSPPTGSRLSPP